jgi:pimeloyl-ACP methyl ester carboxylesterase
MDDLHVVRQFNGGEFSLTAHVSGPQDGAIALLLHGCPQYSAMWARCLDGLHGLGLRTVAFDQRGYSPAPQPTDVAAYGLSTLVDDAVAVLEAVSPGGEALVVGHDWGSLVAWAMAATHPERVGGLVAVSVPHPAALAHAIADDPEQRERSTYIGLMRSPTGEQALAADGGRRLRQFYDRSTMPEAEITGYVERMLAPGMLTGPLNWYRANTNDALTAVPPVEVPTVFLSAELDRAVGAAAVEGCADWARGPYRHTRLLGATHWVPDEHPEAVVDAVTEVRGLAAG